MKTKSILRIKWGRGRKFYFAGAKWGNIFITIKYRKLQLCLFTLCSVRVGSCSQLELMALRENVLTRCKRIPVSDMLLLPSENLETNKISIFREFPLSVTFYCGGFIWKSVKDFLWGNLILNAQKVILGIWNCINQFALFYGFHTQLILPTVKTFLLVVSCSLVMVFKHIFMVFQ